MEETTKSSILSKFKFSKNKSGNVKVIDNLSLVVSLLYFIVPSASRGYFHYIFDSDSFSIFVNLLNYIFLTVLLLVPIASFLIHGMSGRPPISGFGGKEDDGDIKTNDFLFSIYIPAISIFYNVFVDFEFENLHSLSIPGAIVFGIMIILLFMTHRIIPSNRRNKLTIYFFLFLGIGIYSFSGTYGANCMYDFSEPKVYEVKVIEKNQTVVGGYKTPGPVKYFVRISKWGHHKDEEKIRIGKKLYDKVKKGDFVNVNLKKGLFNVTWYYLD